MRYPANRIYWSRVLPLLQRAEARGRMAGWTEVALLNSGMMTCRRNNDRQQEALMLTHLARSDSDCSRKEPTR
ncbi:MAG: hypothetical protein OXF32_11230 [Anaerolineaceae bacterium]|nr:hypothetical protein [Anaerolineaceae bacterium]